jgi:hypothetical protein
MSAPPGRPGSAVDECEDGEIRSNDGAAVARGPVPDTVPIVASTSAIDPAVRATDAPVRRQLEGR